MKLTKLYIHNYKSFYDTTIELDKMNIVVGENNSGKSNLIDVLEFVDVAMSKDIERAISQKGGYDNIKNYSAIGEEKVVIRATFFEKLVFSFSFTQNYSILSFYFKNKYIISNKKYFREKNKEYLKIVSCSKKLKTLFLIAGAKTDLQLYRNIYQISTYYFNIQKIRTLSNQDSKYKELLKDGSNLGKTLFNIKEKDENRFEIISNSLITTVNEIDGIELYSVAGNYIVAFRERGDEPIPIHKVSDGTINFLATITALEEDTKSSLLVFEECERHLHLNVINYLLENFRASEKQILITTHSTEILKYANLDEIVFIYRDGDGDTQSIRARDIPDLEGKMERLGYERPLTLDELIASNIVGSFE